VVGRLGKYNIPLLPDGLPRGVNGSTSIAPTCAFHCAHTISHYICIHLTVVLIPSRTLHPHTLYRARASHTMRPNTLTVNTQPHSLRPRVSHCAITQFSRITPASRSSRRCRMTVCELSSTASASVPAKLCMGSPPCVTSSCSKLASRPRVPCATVPITSSAALPSPGSWPGVQAPGYGAMLVLTPLCSRIRCTRNKPQRGLRCRPARRYRGTWLDGRTGGGPRSDGR